MRVVVLEKERLEKIKRALEENKEFSTIAFQFGIEEGEYESLMDRLIKEVGYKKKD